jgi:hypothetical protein
VASSLSTTKFTHGLGLCSPVLHYSYIKEWILNNVTERIWYVKMEVKRFSHTNQAITERNVHILGGAKNYCLLHSQCTNVNKI